MGIVIFLERFILPILVGLIVVISVTNPMELEKNQRIFGTLAILAIAGIIAYSIHHFNHKNLKSLGYRTTLGTGFLGADISPRDRFTVFFDNEPIQRPSIHIVEFFNEGRKALVKGDFDNSIEIDFSYGKVIFVDFNLNSFSKNIDYT